MSYRWRFRIRKEWAQIPESDSITVYVRTGALGFDFIEKFGE
jgi:hypothetical protein